MILEKIAIDAVSFSCKLQPVRHEEDAFAEMMVVRDKELMLAAFCRVPLTPTYSRFL